MRRHSQNFFPNKQKAWYDAVRQYSVFLFPPQLEHDHHTTSMIHHFMQSYSWVGAPLIHTDDGAFPEAAVWKYQLCRFTWTGYWLHSRGEWLLSEAFIRRTSTEGKAKHYPLFWCCKMVPGFLCSWRLNSPFQVNRDDSRMTLNRLRRYNGQIKDFGTLSAVQSLHFQVFFFLSVL